MLCFIALCDWGNFKEWGVKIRGREICLWCLLFCEWRKCAIIFLKINSFKKKHI